jgi:hypothetical protein
MEAIFDWVGLRYKRTTLESRSNLREGAAG